MGNKNNRSCIICNKSYRYCPTCGEDSDKPSWYFIFDSERCHDIYEICTQYRDKNIDVQKAYERISKLDISDSDNFPESTQVQIKEIIVNGKEPKITIDKAKTNNTKNENKK